MKTGLQVRLSQGTAVAQSQPVNSPAPATQLSQDDAQNVLKRLRPLKAEPSDEQDFALRDRSLPPPRTGKTITDSFPPSEKLVRRTRAAGRLEVRYSPEGDVPLVPQLSVTFLSRWCRSLRIRTIMEDYRLS
jgi:hypothetical protein